MNKEELFNAFKVLFPNWVEYVNSYKKIGSKTLAIEFRFPCYTPESHCFKKVSRVFLYVNEDNWQFGTKLWRKRPDNMKKESKFWIQPHYNSGQGYYNPENRSIPGGIPTNL